MNQKELITRCKRNDYKAQLEVYHRYKNAVFNACLRLLKNREDAEDMVHDTMITGFQKMRQLNEDANLGAWLKRIAINKTIDLIRRRKKILAEDLNAVEIHEDEPEPDYTQVKIETVKTCIENLKDKYRIVLVLYLLENYTHKEIAALLELKESTVRNQYRRGKQQLVEQLKPIMQL